MSRRENTAFIFRIITAAVCVWGVAACMIESPNPVKALLFYTVQSNIICALLFIYTIIRMAIVRGFGEIYYFLKGSFTMAIIITMLVTFLVLKPQADIAGVGSSLTMMDFTAHLAAPLLVFFDWLLFDEKGHYKFIYSVYWLAIPAIYLLFTKLYQFLGGSYYGDGMGATSPYFFLDAAVVGTEGVIKWCVVIAAAMFFLSFTFVCLDRAVFSITRYKYK